MSDFAGELCIVGAALISPLVRIAATDVGRAHALRRRVVGRAHRLACLRERSDEIDDVSLGLQAFLESLS